MVMQTIAIILTFTLYTGFFILVLATDLILTIVLRLKRKKRRRCENAASLRKK